MADDGSLKVEVLRRPSASGNRTFAKRIGEGLELAILVEILLPCVPRSERHVAAKKTVSSSKPKAIVAVAAICCGR